MIREEFIESLNGSTEYLAKQIFKIADEISKKPIEKFTRKQFVKLLNTGRWVSGDASYKVKRLLRSYSAFLNERGVAFDLHDLDSIETSELNQESYTGRYYVSFREMKSEFKQIHSFLTEWRDKSILLLCAVGLSYKEIVQLRPCDIDAKNQTITTGVGVYHEVENFVIEHLLSKRFERADEIMFKTMSNNVQTFTERSARNAAYNAVPILECSNRSMLPNDLEESYMLLKIEQFEIEQRPGKITNVIADKIEYWTARPITPRQLKKLRVLYRDWKATL